jgi:NTP pyrophosphatase (non-canonical NTP hydrolase)
MTPPIKTWYLKEEFSSMEKCQSKIKNIEESRGHIIDSVLQKCLILGEEIGELFKAIRERENLPLHDQTSRYSVDDELADCLFLISCIANRYDIDLQDAIYVKINKDSNKRYSVKPEE